MSKIMVSSSITSWQIEGGKVEAVTDFLFSGSQITEDDDCSHEIKRHLLLWRKAMVNLDSILKSRNITLPTEVCTVKDVVFTSSHVRMWELDHKEGWTLKKELTLSNCDAFQKKTLTSPLNSMEIKPISSKGNQSDEMVRKNHQLNGHEFEQTSGDAEGQGFPTDCMLQSMGLQRVGHALVIEQQQYNIHHWGWRHKKS